MLPEVRVARIVEAIGRYGSGRLSCLEAAEVLGMSERHFRRLRDRYETEGAEGLIDWRRGRAFGRRAPVDQIEWLLEQYRTRYWDFTTKHFHEHLVCDHGFAYGYTWTKLQLQRAGLVKPAKRRGVHRRRRPRRPLPGMLVFQDASPFRWLAALDRELDLVASMDDATSEVYSAFLVEEESTHSSFRGLQETIEAKGLFCSFYTDRGSHYFVTPKAGGKVDKERPTQVGRALSQLGIEHIPSYSPQARGRVERLFGTLQNRLPQELRLAVPSIYSIVPPNDGSALRHGHHFEPVDFVIDHGRGHHDAYSAGSCQRIYARAYGCRQRPRRHREELIESERRWSGREAFVTMMQTADLGQGNDRSGPGRLNGSSIRCVLAERQVGP